MGDIQTVEGIEEKKEIEENQEDKEIPAEIKGQIMTHHGKCKECGRIDKTYKEKCFWCFLEKTREIAQELSSEISNNGRSSLIDVDKIKPTRDKLLEMV